MPRYTFSGHETFPLRYAWVPKGLRELDRNSNIFFEDDAIVRLGVGKNMVRAIRHWCCALGLAEVDGRADLGRVTDLGRRLFLTSDDGDAWDPYLEDPGTLWLFQWQLASRKERASTWHLVFTKWASDAFQKQDLTDWLVSIADDLEASRATRNSIKRDVDVFIRTYVPSDPSPYRPPEDSFDSPLVELGLLRQESKSYYRFVRGEKSSLPNEVFAYALVDFWANSMGDRATTNFESLLYEPGSPGGAFKLTHEAMAARLESLPKWVGVRLDETAGERRVLRRPDIPLPKPMQCLEEYYEHSRAGQVA